MEKATYKIVLTAEIGEAELKAPPLTLFTFTLNGFEFARLIEQRERFLRNNVAMDDMEVVLEIPRVIGSVLGIPVRLKICNFLDHFVAINHATG